jgi:VCBS repeat-containing protein
VPQESAWATVTITITGVNDAPTVQPIEIMIFENDLPPAPGMGVPFVGNDVDSDHLPADLIYNIDSPTGLGRLWKGNADPADAQTFYFDPGTDFDDLQEGESRVVKFTYKATDKHGAVSALATVTITVKGQNDAPTATNFTISTAANAATVAPFDADDVDHDDDSSTLGYTVDLSMLGGTTRSVIVGTTPTSSPVNGFFEFDPGSDFQHLAAGVTQSVTFKYTATDSHVPSASATATVTVNVTGVNEAPTVTPNLMVSAMEDGAPVIKMFLGDDVDDDDTPTSLIYSLIGQLPANSGTLVNNNNGTFTFSPGADFQNLPAGGTRLLTFQYRAQDKHGAFSTTETGTITVTGKNDAPVAASLSFGTGENQPLTASFSGSDIDTGPNPTFTLQGGGTLSNNGTVLTFPSGGTVTNNGTTFTFDPGTAFDGLAENAKATVTFTYFAVDAAMAQSGLATVTITVTGANDAPTAQTVTISAFEDGPLVPGLLAGDDIDSDDDASSLSYTITSSPTAGNVIHSGGQSFSFDPGPDFQELALNVPMVLTFTYQVRDRFGLASPTAGTVTVTVTGRNDAPVVSNISGLVAVENGPAITGNFVAQDVDSDETGSGITYTVVSQPAEGSVTPTTTAAGSTMFSFDPGLAFQNLSVGQSRQVTFTYRAADTHMASVSWERSRLRSTEPMMHPSPRTSRV